MYEVTVEETFAAGHALRNYHGKCENVHGHNYKVQITFAGPRLDDTGLLVDFVHVKRLMRSAIERLDHQFLNDLAPFDRINPSAENIARYFYEEIAKGLTPETPVQVDAVRIWETDTASATYRFSPDPA
jgi:6-pyruvoyltetrahydropterin/6-carboxytetrahydropterin synthase